MGSQLVTSAWTISKERGKFVRNWPHSKRSFKFYILIACFMWFFFFFFFKLMVGRKFDLRSEYEIALKVCLRNIFMIGVCERKLTFIRRFSWNRIFDYLTDFVKKLALPKCRYVKIISLPWRMKLEHTNVSDNVTESFFN